MAKMEVLTFAFEFVCTTIAIAHVVHEYVVVSMDNDLESANRKRSWSITDNLYYDYRLRLYA